MKMTTCVLDIYYMSMWSNKIAAGNRRCAFSFGRRGRLAAPRLRRGVISRACA
jgi:hypothetical protein